MQNKLKAMSTWQTDCTAFI